MAGFGRLGLNALGRIVRDTRPMQFHLRREFSGRPKRGGQGRGTRQNQSRSGGKRGVEIGGVGRVRKGGSSGLWMKRHLKDPYVVAAIEAGAPSRAAFKLVEINDKHGVLSTGDRVVDLGAAPGGWSMVAARIVHARGPHSSEQRGGRVCRGGARGGAPPRLPPPLPAGGPGAAEQRDRRAGAVVAVDLLDLESDLPGVDAICGDFRDPDVVSRIFAALAARELQATTRRGRHQRRQQPPVQPPTTAKSVQEIGPMNKETDFHQSGVYRGGREDFHSEEAFLLRGSSASTELLPRPEQPPTDHLGKLFTSAESPPAASAAAATVVIRERDRASIAGHRDGLGGPLRKGDVNNHLPPAPPHPNAPQTSVRRANVVLSDMAPSFSGDRDMDQGRAAALMLDALSACLGNEASRRRESLGTSTGRAENEHQSDGVVVRKGTDMVGPSCAFNADAGGLHWSSPSVGGPGGQVTKPNAEILPSDVGRNAGSTIGSDKGSSTISRRSTAGKASGKNEFGIGAGLLARGGTFLGKLFAGRDEREVRVEAERLFESVRLVKPPASRSASGEMYLLAKGFLLDRRSKRSR